MSDLLRLEHGDALSVQHRLSDGCVHTVVTSPPYYGLRDYGGEPLVWGGDPACAHEWPDVDLPGNRRGGSGAPSDAWNRGETYGRDKSRGRYCHCGAWRGCLGLEPTPDQYIANLVEIFRETRRVLRDDGTLWLNLGDSYGGTWETGRNDGGGPGRLLGKMQPPRSERRITHRSTPKNLLGIPWRVALAMQADGWILRSDIIWAKPNPMPESVRDRPTKSHEHLFLFAKQPRYFYDAEAVREPAVNKKMPGSNMTDTSITHGTGNGNSGLRELRRRYKQIGLPSGRNRRDVWFLPTPCYRGAHFATFPERLVEPCILAGTSAGGCCPWCLAPYRRILERQRVATRPGTESKVYEPNPELKQDTLGDRRLVGFNQRWRDAKEIGNRDPGRHVTTVTTLGWEPGCDCGEPFAGPCTVLDPFAGTCTAGVVANRHKRRFIGIEPNAEYLTLARRRLGVTP